MNKFTISYCRIHEYLYLDKVIEKGLCNKCHRYKSVLHTLALCYFKESNPNERIELNPVEQDFCVNCLKTKLNFKIIYLKETNYKEAYNRFKNKIILESL